MSAISTGSHPQKSQSRGFTRRPSWLNGTDAGAIAVLILLILVFSVTAKGFATADNARSIVISIATVACIALGQNFVMMAGEIDVSVGSIVALAGFLAGPVGAQTGSLILTLILCLAIGAGCGVINGMLVAWTRIPSIVVTLGTLYVFQGVSLIVSQSHDIVSFPPSASGFGSGSVLGVPHAFFVLVVAFVLLAFLRRHTNWGRDVLPTGEHRDAAWTMGVRVRSELVGVYVLSGLAAGLGTVVYLGSVGGVQSSIVNGNMNLQVIAACAIGGTSIEGGRGTDLAPVTGAAIVGVITAGVVILGVPGVWMSFAYGACLLVAVARDRVFGLVASRRRGND